MTKFQRLFQRHSYNVRSDAVFDVGEGWEDAICQASAALLGFSTKVWIKGGRIENDGLVLDVEFEGEPDEATGDQVRRFLQSVHSRTRQSAGHDGISR